MFIKIRRLKNYVTERKIFATGYWVLRIRPTVRIFSSGSFFSPAGDSFFSALHLPKCSAPSKGRKKELFTMRARGKFSRNLSSPHLRLPTKYDLPEVCQALTDPTIWILPRNSVVACRITSALLPRDHCFRSIVGDYRAVTRLFLHSSNIFSHVSFFRIILRSKINGNDKTLSK